MLSNLQMLVIIGLTALGTLLTRALPFLLFPANKTTPPYILYLGKVLPFAVIGMLVVFCFRHISIIQNPNGIPELLGVLAVTALYLWRRNNLLAIGGGTVFYMFLVQVVFVL